MTPVNGRSDRPGRAVRARAGGWACTAMFVERASTRANWPRAVAREDRARLGGWGHGCSFPASPPRPAVEVVRHASLGSLPFPEPAIAVSSRAEVFLGYLD